MKRTYFLIPLLLLAFFTFGQNIPKPTGKLISDYARILNQKQEERLEKKLRKYLEVSSTEIAVVTILSLEGEDPKLYTKELIQQWLTSRNSSIKSLMVLISAQDQEIVIQNAFGLESVLVDDITQPIVDVHMLPKFKLGNYYGGIDAGTDQIIEMLANPPEEVPATNNPAWSFDYKWLILIVFIGIVVFLSYWIRSRRSKNKK